MKQIFASLIFVLTFACSVVAQSDYNFSFYPGGRYTKIETTNKQDTTSKEIVAQTDTVTNDVVVLIEKLNGRFSVRTLSNISETLYDMNVTFVGVDENRNMVYKAKTTTGQGETLFVNPLSGIAEIVFQTCFDEPQPGGTGLVKKHCNVTRHIFGNIAAPPPTKAKPSKPVKPK